MKITESFNDRMKTIPSEVSSWLKSVKKEKTQNEKV